MGSTFSNLIGMKIASITKIVIGQIQNYLKEKPEPSAERKAMFFTADMEHNQIWHEE